MKIKIVLFAAAGTALVWTLLACGPMFPNMLLNGGDRALLVAPVANFWKEIQGMKLNPPRFASVPAQQGYAEEAADQELADLREALTMGGFPEAEIPVVLERHATERTKVRLHTRERRQPNPPLLDAAVAEGLPGEFADYFRGAIAWHNDQWDLAQAEWEKLLERPEEERRFKSTWAAFMLGKAELASRRNNPEAAIRHFRTVRDLARSGFRDPIGLAASSLGWEARVHFHAGDYQRAIELYLEQMASNDSSAVESLRIVARAALNQEEEIVRRLASHDASRKVITAFLTSRMEDFSDSDWSHSHGLASGKWLEAVEAENVRDVALAEKLALAAYQAGEMDVAQRWIDRASRESAPARWLQSKLLLYRGEVDEAAVLLAELVRGFSLEPATEESGFTNWLARPATERLEGDKSFQQQILGELGALRLARREFAQALDLLLRSGFWVDAAYVAERVLTVDELKELVDRNWPAVADESPLGEQVYWGAWNESRIQLHTRYLLARRLAREERYVEAREYYPKEWLPDFDRFARLLESAREAVTPEPARARAYLEAARLARFKGLELFGTETDPDWRLYDGDYNYGVSVSDRAGLDRELVKPADEELDRAWNHGPNPARRFHYRYTAASLAMQAANLLPDNDDETARILYMAGSWLKGRDPEAADLFYKTLVRRCRETELGAEADRIRWFPQLDAEGKLVLPNRAK
jgi:hypothetical protein